MRFFHSLNWLCLLAIITAGKVFAAQTTVVLGGTRLQLEDVTTEVEVHFRAMRFNRAQNIWNFEAFLTNRSIREIRGPFVLVIESVTGSTGPLQTDGLDESNPPRPFYDFSAAVPDLVLSPGERSIERTLAVGRGTGTPQLNVRVYAAADQSAVAIAFVRTLDSAGQPLGEVLIEQTGAETNAFRSEGSLGVASIGAAGQNTWKFSAPGFLPVWRAQVVLPGGVTLVPSPRLTARSTNAAPISVLQGGRIQSPGVDIQVPPGVVAQNTEAGLTAVDSQSLPAFLPLGWSPLQAFWFETAGPISASVSLKPWGTIRTDDTLVLAKLDEVNVRWVAAQLLAGNGTNELAAQLNSAGAYVLAIADRLPSAPPQPQVGSALAPVQFSLPFPANLSATGTVTPAVSAASRIPERVTATAEAVITNSAGAMPSGLVLQSNIRENYRLRDGSSRTPPQYESFIVAYQQPGDATASTLHARFPLRPMILFGPEELDQATVTVNVLDSTRFDGAVLTETGGAVSSGRIRIIAGAGDVARTQAIKLRTLNPADFIDLAPSNSIEAVFEVAISGVVPERRLAISLESAAPNANYAIARIVYESGQYGLQPVERLRTDAAGVLSSAEPASGERLDGVSGPGQYVIVRTSTPQQLVLGTARNSLGQPTSGIPVRVEAQPWLAISGAGGAYKLIAPAGDTTVSSIDLSSGDTARTTFAVNQPVNVVNLATSASGPSAFLLSPTNVFNVSRIAEIQVAFSEPVNPGTLTSNGVQILTTNGPVAASVVLNLRNTILTILPNEPLAGSALHTVTISTNIADLSGLSMVGPNTFTFTTESDLLDRAGVELVIFEPGATNIPANVLNKLPGFEPGRDKTIVVAHGSPGAAEPGQPVILVNEATGETSTVLSEADGSFYGFIRAEETDYISSVLVNANGTRLTLRATRQKFDDGSVGLFNSGGTVQAEDGGPALIIPPGTIQGRTRFKVENIALQDLPALTGNTPPANAKAVAAMSVKISGDPATGPSDVAFPINAEDLQVLPGFQPEQLAFALTVARNVDGQTVYETVDKLKFKDGKLVPNTPPFLGLLAFIGSAVVGVTFEEAAAFNIVAVNIGAEPVIVTGSVSEEVPLNPGTPQAQIVKRTLPGSFVYAEFVGGSVGLRGRLPAGAVYATADEKGKFVLALPLDAGSAAVPFTKATDYLLSATHPKYSRPEVAPFPLSNFGIGIGRDVIFERDLVFELGSAASTIAIPPAVNVSHLPIFPSTNAPAQIQINATHPNALPTIQVRVKEVSADATLENVEFEVTDTTSVTPRHVRTRATLSAEKRMRVLLEVVARATTSGGIDSSVTNIHIVDFGDIPEPGDNPLPVADKSDSIGPAVIFSDPPPGGTLNPGAKIRVDFSEPIDRAILANPAAITCIPQFSGGFLGGAGIPTLVLSPDQSTLEISFPNFQPGQSYLLILPSQILDLTGNSLDQKPGEAGSQTFELKFETSPLVERTLPELINGGGIVSRDNFLFALERSGDGALLVYDVSKPSEPTKVASAVLQGTPRDLVLIPQYSYVLRRGETPRTADLLAVVGGDLGTADVDEGNNLFFRGQYLRIFDISDPRNPVRLATAILSRGPAAVSKVRWHPPFLTYFENGSDLQQVALVDLQEMLIGFSATQQEAVAFPEFGVIGIDKNGDGDYVDAGDGDRVPLPPKRPAGFFGRKQSFLLQDTAQQILDYDFDVRRFSLSFALGSGKRISNGIPVGEDLPPSYRTFLSGGQPVDAAAGRLSFGVNSRPKRVFTLLVPFLEVGTTNTSADLALVSLAPDDDGSSKLAVIDITLPETPELLRKIPIPQELGLPQSIFTRPNGLLALATANALLLLDPAKLALPNPAAGTIHQSIVSIIPGAGSGNISLAAGSSIGIHAINLGDRHVVVQTPPLLQFVSLLDQPGLLDPSTLVDQPALVSSLLGANLEKVRTETSLEAARLRTEGGATNSLSPADPAAHYYVLMRAPGGEISSGATIELGLESLNRAGHPLMNKGDEFPPVRSVSPASAAIIGQAARSCDAEIRPLTAFRLSSDPKNPLYNFYLSKPFALIYERVPMEELAALRNGPVREILWSGHFLRAFIDKSASVSPAVGAFAAGVDLDLKIFKPRAVAVAETFPATYVMGKNPAPVNGGVQVPGTFGTVSAHNGEFRTDTIDMALPSRRMPIIFERSINGQDLFEGPLGRGWDFNYNQHLVELRQGVFSSRSRMPQVLRQTQNSEIADQRDVILVNGAGRIIVFKFESSSPPPDFLQDPLVRDVLEWNTKANSFYLPKTPGVFDLLVRFPDGQFARVTRDGTQFWYSSRGRLEKIYDRFPGNQHVLEYNERGELTRIVDKSVTDDRFLEIGYWRLPNDLLTRVDVDLTTNKVFIAGRIAQLKDYAGRTVQFLYTEDGILSERLGVELSGANGGFSGRPRTIYLTGDSCSKDIRGINAGASQDDSGASLFAANVNEQTKTASGGNGAAGAVSFSPPGNNAAANVGSISTAGTGPDGSKTSFKFDNLGYAKEIDLSGPVGEPAKYETIYNDLGLVERIVYPEGNSVTYTYDVDAPLRAKANVLREVHSPGAREADPPELNARYFYDRRYNLQVGKQTDFNGKEIEYFLRNDGREVERIDYGGDGTQTFAYNSFGQLELSKDPQGVETKFFYNESTDGFKREELRGDVISFKYSYDSTIAGKLGVPTTVIPPEGATMEATYDGRLSLIQLTRGDLDEKRAYDENGNTTLISRSLGDGQRYEEKRKYNQINFLEKVTVHKVQVGSSTPDLETKYTPDSAWRVGTVTLPGGESRIFKYDHQGNLVRMESGDYNEDYVLDRHGNLRIHRKKGTLVQETKYDGYDRPVLIKRPGSRGEEQVIMTYFGKGETKSTQIVDPEDGEVFLEQIAATDLDALGRPTKVTRKGTSGDAIVRYAYPASLGGQTITSGPRVQSSITHDGAGRVTENKVESLFTAAITPDKIGNVLSISSSENGETYALSYSYNSLNHRDSVSDLVGSRATYEVRHDGLPTTVRDGLQRETELELSPLGEVLSKTTPNQVSYDYAYDKDRQPTSIKDRASQGHTMEYKDPTTRITRKDLRMPGKFFEFKEPNELNLPKLVEIPGGTMELTYDLQGRVTSQDASFDEGEAYETQFLYDALGRIRKSNYGKEEQYSADYTYDKLGPIRSATYNEAFGSRTVGSTIYSDGTRQTLSYPSGGTAFEDRELNGRLAAISFAGGQLYRVDAYAGIEIPRSVSIGGGVISGSNIYDKRKRLLARRYESNGRLLADVRYKYDLADNILVRQQVHRHGRADIFTYDAGNRLKRAEVGARPIIENAVRVNAAGLNGGEGFVAGLFAREYTYDGNGLDLLQSVSDINPDALILPSLPPVANTISGHDGFLFARTINGVDRGETDSLGNAKQTILQVRNAGAEIPAPLTNATLTYNGFSQLVKIERPDGLTITYEHQPNGLMHHRTVSQGGTVLEENGFVYDQGRLIEEYAKVGSDNVLQARYFYADEDSPFAAEIRQAGSANLQRFYYLKDALGSVMAVADDSGRVVERINYDPFGQPEIQALDDRRPTVAAVIASVNNEMLILFTEPIMPRLPNASAGQELITAGGSFEDAFEMAEIGPVILSSSTYEENLPTGFPFGAVVRLRPQGVLGANPTLTINAGSIVDEWGNTNEQIQVRLNRNVADGVFFQGSLGVGDTAPRRIARSAIANPFLFHGQYFDYDAGLLYLRARFYDPFTGHFLQRDPEEFEDSVNQYAGFAHNPTSMRDPSGRNAARVVSVLKDFLAQRAMGQMRNGVTSKLGALTVNQVEAALRTVPFEHVTKNKKGEVVGREMRILLGNQPISVDRAKEIHRLMVRNPGLLYAGSGSGGIIFRVEGQPLAIKTAFRESVQATLDRFDDQVRGFKAFNRLGWQRFFGEFKNGKVVLTDISKRFDFNGRPAFVMEHFEGMMDLDSPLGVGGFSSIIDDLEGQARRTFQQAFHSPSEVNAGIINAGGQMEWRLFDPPYLSEKNFNFGLWNLDDWETRAKTRMWFGKRF